MKIQSLNSPTDGGGYEGSINTDPAYKKTGCGGCGTRGNSQSNASTPVMSAMTYKKSNANFSSWPTVQNGMLVFRDGEQFSAYTQYLSDALIAPSESLSDGNQQDANSILASIEQRLGFTSLRNVTEAAFQKLNEVGWKRLQDIPEKHFIPDLALRSALNPNTEVQVGDKITHFVNSQFAVTVDASNQQLLYRLRALPEHSSFDAINALAPSAGGYFSIEPMSNARIPQQDIQQNYRTGGPIPFPTPLPDRPSVPSPVRGPISGINSVSPNVYPSAGGGPRWNPNSISEYPYPVRSTVNPPVVSSLGGFDVYPNPVHVHLGGGVIDESTGSGIHIIGTSSGKPTGYGTCTLNIEGFHTDDDPCSVSEKHVKGAIYLFESYIGGSIGVSAFRLNVHWGDGTNSWYTNNLVAHDYPAIGTYTVFIEAYNDSMGTSSTPCVTKTFSMHVPNTCYHGVGGQRMNVWAYRSDGYRAIRCSNWVKFKHPLGAPPLVREVKTGARTEAFHWEKNFWGEWTWREYDKAQRLIVQYSIDWTKDDMSCSPWYNDSAANWPWHVQTAEVEQTGDGPRSWQKITSHHEMWTDDGWPPVTLDLETHPCQG